MSQSRIQVGDVITLTANSGGIGMGHFGLLLDSVVLTNTPVFDSDKPGGSNPIFSLVSASSKNGPTVFVLKAIKEGTTTAVVTVNGEAQTAPNVFSWTGGSSKPLKLTVESGSKQPAPVITP